MKREYMSNIEHRQPGDVVGARIVDQKDDALQREHQKEVSAARPKFWGESERVTFITFLEERNVPFENTDEVRVKARSSFLFEEMQRVNALKRNFLRGLFVEEAGQIYIPRSSSRFFEDAFKAGILTRDSLEPEFITALPLSPEELNANDFATMAYYGALTIEASIKLIEWRKDFLERLNIEWREQFHQMKEDYKVEFQKAIEEGIIPADDSYIERIHRAILLVQEPLVMGSVGEHRGGFIVDVGVDGRDVGAIRKTVFHELNHLLSGSNHIEQQAVYQKGVGEGENWHIEKFLVAKYRTKKAGLSFDAHHPSKSFDSTPNWLNEGVTEMLARRLAGVDTVTSYSFEQEVIQGFIDAGIEFKFFTYAYFESLDPAKKEQGYPAFRALNAKIVKLKGAGWLKIIQKQIDERYRSQASR